MVGGALLRWTKYRELTRAGERLPLFGAAGWGDGEIVGRAADDLWMYRPRHGDVAHGILVPDVAKREWKFAD